MAAADRKWWKEAVCYQVWPASFKDSNGDGLGDLPGILSKLDYLKSLGVDAVWISPMYDSPRNDMGYDVRDYENVDPDFGTLQDVDNLIKGLHDRGMRLLLDLVVNHTSDEHKWFQESKKSRDNPYSDYYIWRDPKIVDGNKVEPNNWASVFGGSAWKYVPERDQYYFHLFLVSQPDVNWEVAEVRQAVYKTSIKFWLERGVDGFRVDAVNVYCKDTTFPDAEVADPKDKFHGPLWKAIVDGPRMHEWLQEQRRDACDPYGDIVLIGEGGGANEEESVKYIDPKNRELDMTFDMGVVWPEESNQVAIEEWVSTFSLKAFRRGWEKPQRLMIEHGVWSTVFLENHDNPRSVTKFGSTNPALRWQSARLLALLLGTLSGTLFLYQGQEIGMSGMPKEWPLSEQRDSGWINYWKEMHAKYPDDATMKEKAINAFHTRGRDHARTPVQWSSEEHAGFGSAKPWIRVNENFREGVNVADQEKDDSSVLNYWRQVVAFRKKYPDILIYGHTKFLARDNEKVLFFTKSLAEEIDPKALVVLNFTDEALPLQLPQEIPANKLGDVLLGTHSDRKTDTLESREGRVYQLL
jgi:oligo-1,6-glucosidase